MQLNTTLDLVLDPSQEEDIKPKLNRHGHKIFTPSHKSEFKRKHGMTARFAVKIARAGSVEAVKKLIKDRKKQEKVAKRKKHAAALSERGRKKGSGKIQGPKKPTGKEKRG